MIVAHARFGFHPVDVTPLFHAHFIVGTLVDDNLLDMIAALLQGLINRGFQRNGFAATTTAIRGNDQFSIRIFDTVTQRFCRESAKYHRVNRTDAGTRLHGDNRLRNHRHIDNDTIALLNTLSGQSIGKTTHLVVQFFIGMVFDIALITLKNNG